MNIKRWLVSLGAKRAPDYVVGGDHHPYLKRWHLLPRNRFFNVYLHQFLRSDDPRALHDHMYANASWLLEGEYVEHQIASGGIHHRARVVAGDVVVRLSGKTAHRIEIAPNTHCWTLFVTGPRYREWGFHCPKAGWVHWRDFTDVNDRGLTGKGCEQ